MALLNHLDGGIHRRPPTVYRRSAHRTVSDPQALANIGRVQRSCLVAAVGLATACSGPDLRWTAGGELSAPAVETVQRPDNDTVDAAASSPGSSLASEPTKASGLPYEAADPTSAELEARVWRLTHRQYQKSVEAFLGIPVDIENLGEDLDSGVYPNLSQFRFVRADLAQAYDELADELSETLTEGQLLALTPCGSLKDECIDEFLETSIERAFRRPAVQADVTQFRRVFEAAQGSGDATLPYRSVLRGLLTSPSFLYRTELGPPADEEDDHFRLTGPETASLLSFSLLDSPPSGELLAAAAAGKLDSVDGVRERVAALIDSNEARQVLERFAVEWFGLHRFDDLEKFEDVFPGFGEIRGDMFDEAHSFLSRAAGFDGNLPSLLTDAVPRADGQLADFYRSDPSFAGDETRTGVLALGAVLSELGHPGRSSPTRRGLFVRDRLLCQPVSLPPGLTPPPLEETEAVLQPRTTRELYELHAVQPQCAGCHKLTDDVGFMFESFDGAGRFRKEENGILVDTSGELVSTDVDGSFADHSELAEALAKSEWVRECAAIQAFRFYFGQLEDGRGLAPVVAGRDALGKDGHFKDLVVALFSTLSTMERVRL